MIDSQNLTTGYSEDLHYNQIINSTLQTLVSELVHNHISKGNQKCSQFSPRFQKKIEFYHKIMQFLEKKQGNLEIMSTSLDPLLQILKVNSSCRPQKKKAFLNQKNTIDPQSTPISTCEVLPQTNNCKRKSKLKPPKSYIKATNSKTSKQTKPVVAACLTPTCKAEKKSLIPTLKGSSLSKNQSKLLVLASEKPKHISASMTPRRLSYNDCNSQKIVNI